MKQKIVFIALCAWVALWLFFLGRDLFLKGSLKADQELLERSLEGKRSYVTGGRLYEFLSLAMYVVPEDAGYTLIGLEADSLDKRRADYYLYPRVETKDAPFVLVYDAPFESAPDYEIVQQLDSARYILKKKEAR